MKQCDKFIIDNLKSCRQEEGNLTVNFHRIPRSNLSSDTSWPSIFRTENFFIAKRIHLKSCDTSAFQAFVTLGIVMGAFLGTQLFTI